MRWTWVLFPFAVIYDLVTRARNHLYNIGNKPSVRFEANVISVGNLSVGGTGKTPTVFYLIEHFLRQGKMIATLSRGYGRKTSGFRIADDDETAETFGDEPLTYYQTYRQNVLVTVAEERAFAIPMILMESPENEVILLDDAFQHRSVDPSFSILLTTYGDPFYRDFVLPAGRLRESRSGASRADCIIVTKCPKAMGEEVRNEVIQKIQKYAPSTPVFFSFIKYQDPIPVNNNKQLEGGARIVSVAGLANDAPFINHLNEHYDLREHVSKSDHAKYALRELQELDRKARSCNAALVTTGKDLVKWQPYLKNIDSPVYVLPIQMSFIDGEEEFLTLVDSSIKKYHREY